MVCRPRAWLRPFDRGGRRAAARAVRQGFRRPHGPPTGQAAQGLGMGQARRPGDRGNHRGRQGRKALPRGAEAAGGPTDLSRPDGLHRGESTRVHPPAANDQGRPEWPLGGDLRASPGQFHPEVHRCKERERRGRDRRRPRRRGVGVHRPEQHGLAELVREGPRATVRRFPRHPLLANRKLLLQAPRRPRGEPPLGGLFARGRQAILRCPLHLRSFPSPLPEGPRRGDQQRPRRHPGHDLVLARRTGHHSGQALPGHPPRLRRRDQEMGGPGRARADNEGPPRPRNGRTRPSASG